MLCKFNFFWNVLTQIDDVLNVPMMSEYEVLISELKNYKLAFSIGINLHIKVIGRKQRIPLNLALCIQTDASTINTISFDAKWKVKRM